MSTTWKVVHLDSPMLKEIGIKVEYGVIISTDAMLQRAQTLLFCPLIDGLDDSGRPLARYPWHVEVKTDDVTASAPVRYQRKLVSTKIVLPISPSEYDRDGLERGSLHPDSRRDVAAMLGQWLPGFTGRSR